MRTLLCMPVGTLAMSAAPSGPGEGAVVAVQRPCRTRPEDQAVIVTAADGGRRLHLSRGQPLRVVLSDNAGIGHAWEIESHDPRLLRCEGQRLRQDPGLPPPPGSRGRAGAPVGGPQQVSFLFRAVAAGERQLRLRHWWPREGPRSADRYCGLRLQVVD